MTLQVAQLGQTYYIPALLYYSVYTTTGATDDDANADADNDHMLFAEALTCPMQTTSV